MALQKNHIADARRDAESRFTIEEIEVARPLLNAFEFHILDTLAKSIASSLNHFDHEQKAVDRAMGKIDYDLGPDGSERHDATGDFGKLFLKRSRE